MVKLKVNGQQLVQWRKSRRVSATLKKFPPIISLWAGGISFIKIAGDLCGGNQELRLDLNLAPPMIQK